MGKLEYLKKGFSLTEGGRRTFITTYKAQPKHSNKCDIKESNHYPYLKLINNKITVICKYFCDHHMRKKDITYDIN